MQGSLAWDDLKLILAVARNGGLSGAARVLRINHATAFRRLNHIEQRLGVRLFERFRAGYVPTPAGEAVMLAAGRIEGDVNDLERRLAGQDLRPSGTVRITTTDTLVPLVAGCLAEIRHAHPEITVDLVVSNAVLSLSRRDADIAVRPTGNLPPELVGRRVSGLAYAAYASAVSQPVETQEVRDRDWIAPDDSLVYHGTATWLRQHVPDARITARADSFVALLEMAKAGLGLAVLPCFLADEDEGLRRIGDPIPEIETALWLLTHGDLRRVARIRAVLDGLAGTLRARRALLEGQSGPA